MLLIHHILPDARLFLGVFVPDAAGPRLTLARVQFPLLRPRIAKGFGTSDPRNVSSAFEKLRAAGARFQAELQPNGYLVGDGFTVADLTAASLVAPIAAPDGFPYPQPQRDHPLAAPVRDALAESGLLAWTREMYARERCKSAAIRDSN